MHIPPHELSSLGDLFKKVKIQEIMNSAVIKVRMDDDFSNVEECFITHGLTHLPVVNYVDKLVGLISQKYLYKTQSPRKFFEEPQMIDPDPDKIVDGDSFYHKETLNSYILHQIMQKDPFTMGPEDSVGEAVKNMANKKLGCIPIVDPQHTICGILTNQDIIKFLARLI